MAGNMDSVQQRLEMAGNMDSVQQRLEMAGNMDSVQQRLEMAGNMDSVQQRLEMAGNMDSVQQRLEMAGNMNSELLVRRCRVRFYAFFGQLLSKQVYTSCSFRLVIQFLTNIVLVLLLRRLVILRRKVKVNKASFNFHHVSGIGTILILDESTPSLKAVSRDKKSAGVRQAEGPTKFNPI